MSFREKVPLIQLFENTARRINIEDVRIPQSFLPQCFDGGQLVARAERAVATLGGCEIVKRPLETGGDVARVNDRGTDKVEVPRDGLGNRLRLGAVPLLDIVFGKEHRLHLQRLGVLQQKLPLPVLNLLGVAEVLQQLLLTAGHLQPLFQHLVNLIGGPAKVNRRRHPTAPGIRFLGRGCSLLLPRFTGPGRRIQQHERHHRMAERWRGR